MTARIVRFFSSGRRGALAPHKPSYKSVTPQVYGQNTRVPSVLRNNKRILVLDTPEDIPAMFQTLNEALVRPPKNLTLPVIEHHYSSLFNFTYKHLFDQVGSAPVEKFGAKTPAQKAHVEMADVKEHAMMDYLREVFYVLRKYFEPTATHYTMMMTACQRVGESEEVVKLYSDMLNEGIKPDIMVYNTVMKAYGQLGNTVAAEDILYEIDQRGLKPDVVTYTVTIQNHIEDNDVDGALQCYEKMKATEVKPSKVTLAALVMALGKKKRLRESLAIFEDRNSLNIHHDEFLYNCMLWNVARKGDMRQARRILQDMVQGGFSPNEMTFTAMVNCIAVSGKAWHVLDLNNAVREGKFGTFKHTENTYLLILSLLGNSKTLYLKHAVKIFADAVEEGHFSRLIHKLNTQDILDLRYLNMGCIQPIVTYALHTMTWRLRPDLQREFHQRQMDLKSRPQRGGLDSFSPSSHSASSLDNAAQWPGLGEPKTETKERAVIKTEQSPGERRFDTTGRNSEKMEEVSSRGLRILTADNEYTEQITECLVRRPHKKLSEFLEAELGFPRHRIEFALHSMYPRVKYEVPEDQPWTIQVTRPVLTNWCFRQQLTNPREQAAPEFVADLEEEVPEAANDFGYPDLFYTWGNKSYSSPGVTLYKEYQHKKRKEFAERDKSKTGRSAPSPREQTVYNGNRKPVSEREQLLHRKQKAEQNPESEFESEFERLKKVFERKTRQNKQNKMKR